MAIVPLNRPLYRNGWPKTMQAALYHARKRRLVRLGGGEQPVASYEPIPVAQDLSIANLMSTASVAFPFGAYLGTVADAGSGGNRTLAVAGTMLQSQSARGLFTDAVGSEHPTLEIGNTGQIKIASATLPYLNYDYGLGQSFAFLVVFRTPVGAVSTDFIFKFNTTGYTIGLNASGHPYITLTATGSATASAAQTLNDGGWHYMLVGHVQGTDVLHCQSDKGYASISTAGLTGSSTNTGVFEVPSNAAGGQVPAIYAWSGIPSETVITNRALLGSAWWTHGTDSTGLNTTYTRASTTYAVGKPNADGETLYGWGNGTTPHVAMGYMDGFGAWVPFDVTNLLTNSAPGNAAWALNAGTSVANDRVNPLGFKRGVKYTSAGTTERLSLTFAATSGIKYMASAYFFWDGTGTAPEVAIENAARTTVASAAATLTNQWERVFCSYTATATEAYYAALWPQVVDGSGGVVWFDHAQVEVPTGTSAYPGQFVATAGSTATSVQASVRANDTRLNALTGESFRQVIRSAQRKTWDFNAALRVAGVGESANPQSERILKITTTGIPQCEIRSSAGSLSGTATATTAALALFDGLARDITVARNAAATRFIYAGNTEDDSVASSSDALQTFFISRASGGPYGVIQSIKVYAASNL